MEKTAGILADVLVKKEVIEQQDRDFYRYSIESLMLYVINFGTMFLLALFAGKFVQCIFFLAVYYPLRTYCGGVHMKHWYSCYVLSCLLVEGIVILAGMLTVGWIPIIIGTAICEVIILVCAPCEHPNHPMELEQMEKIKEKVVVISFVLFYFEIALKYFEQEEAAVLVFGAFVLASVLLVLGKIVDKNPNSY
jgi:accessory gene regulator B